jgi:hypothetical protein
MSHTNPSNDHTNAVGARLLMDLLDENKDTFDDGQYLTMANALKALHGGRVNSVVPDWLQPESYCVMGPSLVDHLVMDDMNYDYRFGMGFELCLRFDGEFDELPEDADLGLVNHPTMFQSDSAHPLRRREDLGGHYFKFWSNVNVPWALYGPDPRDHLMKPLWLSPWMLGLLSPIGDGHFYTHVVTYPLCYGWGRAMFVPMRQVQEVPSLFERFVDDDEDEGAMELVAKLDDDHPLRWVGCWRGMQHGSQWKTLRDHVRLKIICGYWSRMARKRARSTESM